MSGQGKVAQIESRWTAIVAILAVLVMLEFLPGRLRIMPPSFPYIAAAILLAPMLAAALTQSAALARLERFDMRSALCS